MQGKKDHQEKLFVNFQLSNYVPADNFYRQLKRILNLDFLYKSTSQYYGKEGQKSIDPVVFMKLMLVGYLENLNSDRRIIGTSRMRMDILYFLGYDLDEELPWHSTLSRTRKLYGEEQFTNIFKQVLKLCIDEGLISGKRQSVDSALIQANASLNKMAERQIIEIMKDADAYSEELDANSDDDAAEPTKSKDQGDDKKTSYANDTHYSPSDPDARLTKKPGKPYDLYYRSQVSVDTASHFITHIQAFPGNQADSACLPEVLKHTVENMQENNIQVKEILADTGYSSGEAIQALIDHNLEGYIPNTPSYKPSREGFTYDLENDRYVCSNGKYLTFKGISRHQKRKAIFSKTYQTKLCDCRDCPLKITCAGKSGYKRLYDSTDKPLYDYMQQRMETPKAKIMSRLRASTVEPVIGSLVNYTGMKRINSKGIVQANKCMTMAAVAYNLKKLLKYKSSLAQNNANAIGKSLLITFYRLSVCIKLWLRPTLSFSFNQYFKERFANLTISGFIITG